jgi:hypothetical protein
VGPRFIGTRLKEQLTPALLQEEHCSTLASEVASHRICIISGEAEIGVPSFGDIHRRHVKSCVAFSVSSWHHSPDSNRGCAPKHASSCVARYGMVSLQDWNVAVVARTLAKSLVCGDSQMIVSVAILEINSYLRAEKTEVRV